VFSSCSFAEESACFSVAREMNIGEKANWKRVEREDSNEEKGKWKAGCKGLEKSIWFPPWFLWL
jgi:hypothetical protein